MQTRGVRDSLSAGCPRSFLGLGVLAGLIIAAAPEVHAQSVQDLLKERKVTLHAEGSLLEEVAGLLQRETGVEIELEEGIEDAEVSGDLKGLPLGEALRILLGSAGLSYEVAGDRVVVRRDPDAPPPPPRKEKVAPPEEGSLEDLIRKGDHRSAEARIREELEAQPEDLSLTLRLASLLVESGRYEESADLLGGAVERAPEEKALRLELGRLNLLRGRYDEAEEHLKACGDLPEARGALGLLYLERLGRREEGRKILLEVGTSVSLRDPRPEALMAAGEALALLGDQEQASKYFIQVVRNDPDRVEAYVRLSELWLHNFEQAEAIRLVEKGLEIHPFHPEARVLRARCLLLNRLLGTRRYALAIADVNRALEVNPSLPEAHIFLADIGIFDGSFGRAREHAEKVLELNPLSIPARARLGAIARLQDDRKEVEALEEAVLKQNPRAYRFFLEVAEILEDRFRYREAADLAKRAIDLEPELGEAYAIRGTNLIRLGEMEEGEEALREAQKKDTNLFVRNSLVLLDELRENYETFRTPHFVIRVHKEEAEVLVPYVRDFLEEARSALGERYGLIPEQPILCEVYIDHNSFSTRIMGLPWVGAVGVCFGPVMAIDSPTAMKAPPGRGGDEEEAERASFSWARTLWHEYTHVVTLLATGNRIPRWFTEGLSVLEESRARPHWSRDGEMAEHFFTALGQRKLLGVGELDRGFTKPEFGGQVLLSYYQGARVCEYIEERWGLEAIRGLLDGYAESLGTEEVFRKVLGIDLEAFDAGFIEHSRKWMKSTGFRAPYSLEQLLELKAAHQASPEDASAAARLSRAYLDVGRIGEGELYAAKAVELDPDLGDAQAAFGRARLRRGARRDAEDAFRRALQLGCDDLLMVHEGLARIARGKKDVAAVFEHLLAMQKLLPMNASISRSLAEIRLDAGAQAAAVPHLEAAARWDPADLESRLKLLEIYSGRGEEEKVIDMGLQILALDPFKPDIHFQLGEALRRAGRGREALREYEVALVLKDFREEEIACGQAELWLEAGEDEKARERAKRALEIRPGSERALRVLEILKAKGGGEEKR